MVLFDRDQVNPIDLAENLCPHQISCRKEVVVQRNQAVKPIGHPLQIVPVMVVQVCIRGVAFFMCRFENMYVSYEY